MRKLFFIILLFIHYPVLFSQNIPGDFLGVWTGTLEMTNYTHPAKTTPMELHLLATDSADQWLWTIIYGEGKTRDERPYRLIRQDTLGTFVVDEGNNILIKEIKLGNRFFSSFSVYKTTLNGIVTFEKDQIIWEIFSYRFDEKINSGNGTDQSPSVESFSPNSYQRAVLRRK